jgi:hypothetical protein
MKAGTEDRKKLMIAGVAGFVAIFCVGYLYLTLFGGPSTPPPAPPPVVAAKPSGPVPVQALKQTGAVKVGSVNMSLDPTLHMDGMLAAESLVYSGTGRNIFAPGPMQAPAPVKLVDANYAARPKGPQGPVVPVFQGPPPKPPINLKFFGTATQDGVKRALLLSGVDVFLASAGDIVQRRYKIVTIAANSITVEDLPNSNSQTLPLVAN